MAQKEIMKFVVPELKTGYEYPTDKDFKAHFQVKYATTCNLCGYSMKFEKIKDKNGAVVYPIAIFDSRDFKPRGDKPDPKLRSVLPEILTKLTHPLNEIGTVMHIEILGGKSAEK